MKPFRYGFDPLCLSAIALYATNRWILKPFESAGFFHDQFDDSLLIPAALPLVLWVQRRLALRSDDRPPSAWEIVFHLILWSLLCEVIGPAVFHHGTADVWDVAAYAVGALVSGLMWNVEGWRRVQPAPARSR